MSRDGGAGPRRGRPVRRAGGRPQRQERQRDDSAVGTEFEVEVGPVAHGGHCVARHGGRVVFVRHTIPGERVRVRVTEGGEGSKFWRADAVEVLEASPDRVQQPCPVARPGLCGGCDFQHVALPAQRELKAAVVAEQLRRLAGLELPVVVEAVPGDEDGLRWRTRTAFAVDAEGRAGLRRHRSHEVVVLEDCPITEGGVIGTGVLQERWQHAAQVEVAVGSGEGAPLVVVTPAEGEAVPRRLPLPRLREASLAVRTAPGTLEQRGGRTWLEERVVAAGAEHRFRVSGAGFWQVHPGAPAVLVEAVLGALGPQPGERALDLYAGAGLFAAALAEAVGVTGTVLAVESDARAVRDARRNLHGQGQVRLVASRVDEALAGGEAGERADVVVLDPPRSGAGRGVVERLAALGPRAVAYVACDPAALARDVATFGELGYRLQALRAFDLFPMTQHVECVALLVPAGES
ncbi:tRNA/tmRNA/rRNA uracil-C5-methylase (TrmA/RlmC/RlmD family) [Kineococcus xinjiangensis]|uniref:tRNA/tmRNA/rRNA uracil-C5-methylase (TrmA/RlmC/RlmD family) n=1 Tax=Kineococcus xinjiangensis TaxID=512762 RepID=A0A2S6IVH7_9ACTN|nr:TRAM domain-containing protein [Kineococcus xinjiangensis]PPK98369.1 tRNA/tmRNA/rRNA uracil-C5-methylase (TrmA/RlmC/RlmD family) [Kineococcus xinjiangensis]